MPSAESSHSLFSLNIKQNKNIIFKSYESKVIFINLFHGNVSQTSPQSPPAREYSHTTYVIVVYYLMAKSYIQRILSCTAQESMSLDNNGVT